MSTPIEPSDDVTDATGLRSPARARWMLLVSIGLTVAVYALPAPYGRFLGWPFVLLSTLAHELGHGIAGWLVGGEFVRFEMFADASGVAMVRGYDSRFARATVSAGGLVGPAIVGALCFVLGRSGRRAKRAFYVIAATLAVLLVLVVRNLFGAFFVLLVIASAVAIARKAPEGLAQLAMLFTGVQLALSVFSRADYLFTDVAHTGAGVMPSDVANMAEALFLPYWFWGFLCGGFSIATLALGLWASWQLPDPSGGELPAPSLPGSAERG